MSVEPEPATGGTRAVLVLAVLSEALLCGVLAIDGGWLGSLGQVPVLRVVLAIAAPLAHLGIWLVVCRPGSALRVRQPPGQAIAKVLLAIPPAVLLALSGHLVLGVAVALAMVVVALIELLVTLPPGPPLPQNDDER
ncbi:MAG: hypothetical protein WAM30_14980 [Candidatus Dormiibacterota bacterium]